MDNEEVREKTYVCNNTGQTICSIKVKVKNRNQAVTGFAAIEVVTICDHKETKLMLWFFVLADNVATTKEYDKMGRDKYALNTLTPFVNAGLKLSTNAGK